MEMRETTVEKLDTLKATEVLENLDQGFKVMVDVYSSDESTRYEIHLYPDKFELFDPRTGRFLELKSDQIRNLKNQDEKKAVDMLSRLGLNLAIRTLRGLE